MIVRVTVSVDGLITLRLPPCLATTQIMPFGARAIDRGAMPTATSPSFARVAASNTLTLSLSWFTTHSRGFAPGGFSTSRLPDAAGGFAVAGRYTAWTTLRLRS